MPVSPFKLAYETNSIVQIPSKFLGLLFWLVQLTVFIYIIFYMFWWGRQHQIRCPVESTLTINLKGVLSTGRFEPEFEPRLSNPFRRVWDASDLLQPSNDGGIVITTDVLLVPSQNLGVCPENPKAPGATCYTNTDCRQGYPLENGIQTGDCVPVTNDGISKTKTCAIESWCPLDEGRRPLKSYKALFYETKDFILTVDNRVEFPLCGNNLTGSNIRPSKFENSKSKYNTDNYSQGQDRFVENLCINSQKDRQCPNFLLSDIVEKTGVKFDRVAESGGVFVLKINWQCDFDWGKTVDDCKPRYSLERVLPNNQTAYSHEGQGFRFQSAEYHQNHNNVQSRTLRQNAGLKIQVKVDGEGRIFSVNQFFIIIGSCIGLLGTGSIVCDRMFTVLSFLGSQKWLVRKWGTLKYFDEDMRVCKDLEAEFYDDNLKSETDSVMEKGKENSYGAMEVQSSG